MAKTKEQNTARILYTEQGKSAKDIAALLGVSEKTISAWVNKHNWKSARDAKAISHTERLENIYKIIENLASDRLRLNSLVNEKSITASTPEQRNEIDAMRIQITQIDYAVANWNKTLANVSKENQINRLTLIQCLEIIFKHFDSMYPQLLEKSIVFQEYFINEVVDTYSVK